MSRFAPVMSMTDFQSTLYSYAMSMEYEDTSYIGGVPESERPIDYEYVCIYVVMEDPKSPIVKDWSKIEFDLENIMLEGFESTPSGIPYVHLLCGGDWEQPVHAIIYFDGKKFRGYVPTDGNTFNPKTKVAYGNEMGDEDYEAEEDPVYLDVDLDALRTDIAGRIVARGTSGAVTFKMATA